MLISGFRSRSRSRRFLGGVGVEVAFLTTLGVGVAYFVQLPLRMSNPLRMSIFEITLLNWEFLLKWYNFFWNCCWNRDFLLCTTISIDFNSQVSFPLCQGVGGSWKFGKAGVGVGVEYFTSDSATQVRMVQVPLCAKVFPVLQWDNKLYNECGNEVPEWSKFWKA